jgi:hypothetical protein
MGKNTPITFFVAIRNRTSILIKHNGELMRINLFNNCIKSISEIITDDDTFEMIIMDNKSIDVIMEDFVQQYQKPNFTIRVIKDDSKFFSKGELYNKAVQYATYRLWFFLDADMLIKGRKIFDDIQLKVVTNKRVLFPICFSYSNPEHTSGWKRDEGVGNVIMFKEMFIPYLKNKKWGGEDTHIFDHNKALGFVARKYYEDEFIHQWHPQDKAFLNQYYELKK